MANRQDKSSRKDNFINGEQDYSRSLLSPVECREISEDQVAFNKPQNKRLC